MPGSPLLCIHCRCSVTALSFCNLDIMNWTLNCELEKLLKSLLSEYFTASGKVATTGYGLRNTDPFHTWSGSCDLLQVPQSGPKSDGVMQLRTETTTPVSQITLSSMQPLARVFCYFNRKPTKTHLMQKISYIKPHRGQGYRRYSV